VKLHLRVATAVLATLAYAFQTSAWSATTGYTYDALGRVITATDPDGTVVSYSYDAAGNRTVRSTVLGVQHNPVAVNDAVSTAANTTIEFDPRINDSDVDNDPLTIGAFPTPPAHGSVFVRSVGTYVRYVPTSSYVGPDSFTYTIFDGRGGSATATVSVTVN
jgi:YD repeat-containing protein